VRRVFVFFGLIASGKSTLAEAFARRYDLPYYNTDRVRKELAGLEAQRSAADGYGRGIYTREFSRKTYQAMLDRARIEMRAGREGIVLDGSYHSREERDRVRGLAAAEGGAAVFVHCVCGEDETRRRLAERERDPLSVSDGRWDIYLVQKEAFQPPAELAGAELVTLSTELPVARLLDVLARELNMEQGRGEFRADG
jgi:predicted kinase